MLAPTANDSAVACSVLTHSGLHAEACLNAEELARRMLESCGVVIIAEEALTQEATRVLHDALEQQEKWSDLPIIVLSGPHAVLTNQLFSKSGNISLLERPFSRFTLVQMVEVALRSRRRQYQIRDLLSQLQQSRNEAERANAAKSQFLANMSHELRTPLNAIIGFSELMDEPELTQEERGEFTATVRRNGRLLTQLIDDILDLSKVEAGKLITERTRCHLPTLLNEVKKVLDRQACDKGILLNFNVDAGVAEYITTDPMRLKQILLNIIGNAIKFTLHGGVDVSIVETRNSGLGGSKLAFIVKDTGHGIGPEQQIHLFSPFTQADSSITRKFGGTGLGLVLSRRLAEMLGGTVELTHSKPGEGSTFTVFIDPGFTEAYSVPGVRVAFGEPYIMGQKETSLNGLTILVAEDSPDNRLLIDRVLKSEGAHVDLAVDGIDAMEHVQVRDYDVVLMDLQMPHLDGLEATARLRAQGFRKPIIALTAHAMKEEREKAMRAGFTDHMSKPINFRELIQKVKVHDANLNGRSRELH